MCIARAHARARAHTHTHTHSTHTHIHTHTYTYTLYTYTHIHIHTLSLSHTHTHIHTHTHTHRTGAGVISTSGGDTTPNGTRVAAHPTSASRPAFSQYQDATQLHDSAAFWRGGVGGRHAHGAGGGGGYVCGGARASGVPLDALLVHCALCALDGAACCCCCMVPCGGRGFR